MTIELYVFPPSPRAFKVLAVANHLGLDYEIRFLDLPKGAHKTPQYAALNPNVRMPTLKDGDYVVWEANAIGQYLAGKKPDAGLLPRDERARLDVAGSSGTSRTGIRPARCLPSNTWPSPCSVGSRSRIWLRSKKARKCSIAPPRCSTVSSRANDS